MTLLGHLQKYLQRNPEAIVVVPTQRVKLFIAQRIGQGNLPHYLWQLQEMVAHYAPWLLMESIQWHFQLLQWLQSILTQHTITTYLPTIENLANDLDTLYEYLPLSQQPETALQHIATYFRTGFPNQNKHFQGIPESQFPEIFNTLAEKLKEFPKDFYVFESFLLRWAAQNPQAWIPYIPENYPIYILSDAYLSPVRKKIIELLQQRNAKVFTETSPLFNELQEKWVLEGQQKASFYQQLTSLKANVITPYQRRIQIHVHYVAERSEQVALLRSNLQKDKAQAVITPSVDIIPLLIEGLSDYPINLSLGLPLQYTAIATFVELLTKSWNEYVQHKKVSHVIVQRWQIHPIGKYFIKEKSLIPCQFFYGINEIFEESLLEWFQKPCLESLIKILSEARYSEHVQPLRPIHTAAIDSFVKTLAVLLPYRSLICSSNRSDDFLRLCLHLLYRNTITLKPVETPVIHILQLLETRALAFDVLFFLDFIQSRFPGRTETATFLTPVLRNHFSLPSSRHKIAWMHFYFYTLLQKAKEVHLFVPRLGPLNQPFSTPIEEEPSIWIAQLQYLKEHQKTITLAMHYHNYLPKVQWISTAARQVPAPPSCVFPLETFSPSQLTTLLRCPRKFYLTYVFPLELEEVSMDLFTIDPLIVGKLFHQTAANLYRVSSTKNLQERRKRLIEQLKTYSEPEALKQIILKTFYQDVCQSTPNDNNTKIVPLVVEVVSEYLKQLIHYDLERLENGEVLNIIHERDFCINGHIKGTIDRIELLSHGKVNLIEFKTGSVSEKNSDNIVKRLKSFVSDYKNGNKIIKPIERELLPWLQLSLYSYGYAQENKGAFTQKSFIVRLSDFSPLEKTWDEQQDATLFQSCEELITFIKNNYSESNIERLFFPIESDECKYCSFRYFCGRY